jgi:hypothetical protein
MFASIRGASQPNLEEHRLAGAEGFEPSNALKIGGWLGEP